MTTKTKDFDCVEMMRRGAERIRREIQGMTEEQELEYWARGTAELLEEQAASRREAKLADPSVTFDE